MLKVIKGIVSYEMFLPCGGGKISGVFNRGEREGTHLFQVPVELVGGADG